MNPRLWLLLVDVIGGVAVLGSYAHGISTHAEAGRALWGGVPPALRPLYQASMVAATAGYFCFTWYLLRKAPLESAWITAIHALFLFPSALWMPFTFAFRDGKIGWWAVRAVLFAVGLGALALVGSLARLEPRRAGWSWALAGAAAFAFQTAVLDALVWPAYFRR